MGATTGITAGSDGAAIPEGALLMGRCPVCQAVEAVNAEPSWFTSVAGAALRWKIARAAVVAASLYPIGNPEYARLLNILSEAEDGLMKAIGTVDIPHEAVWPKASAV